MKKNVQSNPIISNDLMRYRKNKVSANLALLGIAFNCLYFMFMYKQVCDNREATFVGVDGTPGMPVYSYIHGASVIINLLVLLFAFLTSERLKNYDKRFAFVAFGLAVVQIVRIFIYPLLTFTTKYIRGMAQVYLTDGAMFALFLVLLCASAACFLAAGILGYLKALKLEKFVKEVNDGTVDLEAALKEEETAQAVSGGEINA